MPQKALKHFARVTIKHTKAGIPDPCIRLRKSAPKELIKTLFNPANVIDIEVGTLLKRGKVKKPKKQPYKKFCLF